jgi:hypothetical protein
MIINNIPTKQSGWTTTEFMMSPKEYSFLKKSVDFMIVHNIPTDDSGINTIQAAILNWLFRIVDGDANKMSDESLIEYINSKGIHKAMKLKDFNEKFGIK